MLRDSLRRRRAHVPTSNTASYDNHEKINSWVSVSHMSDWGYACGPLKLRYYYYCCCCLVVLLLLLFYLLFFKVLL